MSYRKDTASWEKVSGKLKCHLRLTSSLIQSKCRNLGKSFSQNYRNLKGDMDNGEKFKKKKKKTGKEKKIL